MFDDRLLGGKGEEKFAIGFLEAFVSGFVSDTVGPLARPAHYLPADRAGIMHAHQVAVRGLIASASRTGLRRDSPMPVLSGVLGDFLEQLVALAGSPQRAHDDYDALALRLENTLLRGAVRVEQSPINYPSFVFQPNGWKRDLPLMNASSMVSELAPVVLYLRHVVQPGDLLIIEEPESHLHPAMQWSLYANSRQPCNPVSASSLPPIASGCWKNWLIWFAYQNCPRSGATALMMRI